MDLYVSLHATGVLTNVYSSLTTPYSTSKAIHPLYHLDFQLLNPYLKPPTKDETPQKHLQDYSCSFYFGTGRASENIIGFVGFVKKT